MLVERSFTRKELEQIFAERVQEFVGTFASELDDEEFLHLSLRIEDARVEPDGSVTVENPRALLEYIYEVIVRSAPLAISAFLDTVFGRDEGQTVE